MLLQFNYEYLKKKYFVFKKCRATVYIFTTLSKENSKLNSIIAYSKVVKRLQSSFLPLNNYDLNC